MDDGGDVIRGDRYTGGPARDFLSSLDDDERLFEADIAVDRAHVIMLAEQGIIAHDQASAILEALAAIEAAGHGALPQAEDVHEAIESAVIDRVGEPGGAMHTARSRNDEVATCIRYRLRTDLIKATDAVIALRGALLECAADSVETVMPGFTHQQPAQPTTVAHWACSYVGALERDTARLFDAYERVNESPLGGAAFAGTTFPIDRERTASLLGFDGLVENAMDASSSRDFLLESTAAMSGVASTLSSLSTDLMLFATLGYLELDDDYASTSSIMPQKKNPDTLELVRACTGDVYGAHQALMTVLKGLPRAYNRDLQRATPHAWRAVDATVQAATVVTGAIATGGWNDQTLADGAGSGFTTATDLADLLVEGGVPFRTAHRAVARAAEMFDDATPSELVDAVLEGIGGSPSEFDTDAAIRRIESPMESVRARDSIGGPAPGVITTYIDTAASRVTDDGARIDRRRAALDAAADRLASEVNRYA